MTTRGNPALVRRLDGSTRATLLELLFDVVFVAALAQTSKLLADQESWAQSAAVALMLTAIWWTWSVTSTTTEFYDPQQRPIQAILMVAMVGSVGMAASLPMVTRGQATVFALAYVGTHVVRGIVLVSTLYRQQHRSAMARATRFLFWFLVSGVRCPVDHRCGCRQ
ncbi:low temperature requirement protein A [Micromonospora orduensis]|nr:low temperature requirement protein A [Micromonospora orduensis]